MVKKLFVLIALTVLFSKNAHAANRVAGASATMAATVKNEAHSAASLTANIKGYALQKRAILRVLKDNNSPMTGHVDSFMKSCMTHKFDCYLLPAIAGHESVFGRMIAPGSYNAFGWGGGYIMFPDWGTGIETVGTALRTNYVTEGPITPEMIGLKYATNTTWSSKIRYYMGRFVAAEQNELHSGDFALE